MSAGQASQSPMIRRPITGTDCPRPRDQQAVEIAKIATERGGRLERE
jgi:hypothetical protein